MHNGLMYCDYRNHGLDSVFNLPLMKNIFVTDFSGPMKAVKLKLGKHMDLGLMYCVHTRIRAKGLLLLELKPSIVFLIYY